MVLKTFNGEHLLVKMEFIGMEVDLIVAEGISMVLKNISLHERKFISNKDIQIS